MKEYLVYWGVHGQLSDFELHESCGCKTSQNHHLWGLTQCWNQSLVTTREIAAFDSGSDVILQSQRLLHCMTVCFLLQRQTSWCKESRITFIYSTHLKPHCEFPRCFPSLLSFPVDTNSLQICSTSVSFCQMFNHESNDKLISRECDSYLYYFFCFPSAFQ